MTGSTSNRWKLFWRPTTGRNLILARASARAWAYECVNACVHEMHDIDVTRRRHSRIDSKPRSYYADVICPANTLPGPIPIRLTGNAILLRIEIAFAFCGQVIFYVPATLEFHSPDSSIDEQSIFVAIKSHNVQTLAVVIGGTTISSVWFVSSLFTRIYLTCRLKTWAWIELLLRIIFFTEGYRI